VTISSANCLAFIEVDSRVGSLRLGALAA
jgi:hypothetical protein